MNQIYVMVDGDDVGGGIEYLLLTNDLTSFTAYRYAFAEAFTEWVERLRRESGGRTLFVSGDNLLALLDGDDATLHTLEVLRASFGESTQWTLSMGLGETPREALIAIEFAKATGKDRVSRFSDLCQGTSSR